MFGHACVGIDFSERQVHTLGEAPTKRTGHSVVLFRDSLLAFGGLGFRVQGLGFCWVTCFIWKSWKSCAAGHIEITRLLPEADARPDTCSHVSFGNPVRQVLSRSSGCCRRQRQDPTHAHMFHLKILVRQVLSRSSACCRRQRQDPTHAHMFHLEIRQVLSRSSACCRRQWQDPTHAHMFHLEIRQVLSRSSACCRRQRQHPTEKTNWPHLRTKGIVARSSSFTAVTVRFAFYF